MLGAVAMTPLALCLDSPAHVSRNAPVTGRVTYAGRPLNHATICLDAKGLHAAYALLRADGSFRIINMTMDEDGALPGRYRVHLYNDLSGPKIPSKYRDPATSGIELEVGPGWNHFSIDLVSCPDEPPR
jgi:hypothetical protein